MWESVITSFVFISFETVRYVYNHFKFKKRNYDVLDDVDDNDIADAIILSH